MDSEEFRQRGKEMVDFIADYLENIKDRKVTSAVEPGYLKKLVPSNPPQDGEKWPDIMKDIKEKIMPGITHWQHPNFHAYFPAGNSYPSLLGDMLSSGLGINGFSWATSPACTELETIIMNWIGCMSGLPQSLLPFKQKESPKLISNNNNNNSEAEENVNVITQDQNNNLNDTTQIEDALCEYSTNSGGVLLGSASECVLVSMLSARYKSIEHYKMTRNSEEDDSIILSKMVAYTSKIAHSCIKKAAMICMVKIRFLPYDQEYSLRGDTVKKAFDEDIKNGLIPFYVAGTFGTTCCCSFDRVDEIGQICQNYNVYLHVDAAYAGNSLICEEFRYLMPGIQYVDSLNYNPNKWMLVNFDCSCLWVKNNKYVINALSVDPVYLRHKDMGRTIDYRNWGISLSRRFKALKLWFTIRSYGVKGLQNYIRNHVSLAKEFEKCILSDNRFELFNKVTLGLVCFSLKGQDLTEANTLSHNLLEKVLEELHMTKDIISNKYMIRFCVNSQNASINDILYAWGIIKRAADEVILDYQNKPIKDNEEMDDTIIEIRSNNLNLAKCLLTILYYTKSKRRLATNRILCEPVKNEQQLF